MQLYLDVIYRVPTPHVSLDLNANWIFLYVKLIDSLSLSVGSPSSHSTTRLIPNRCLANMMRLSSLYDIKLVIAIICHLIIYFVAIFILLKTNIEYRSIEYTIRIRYRVFPMMYLSFMSPDVHTIYCTLYI